MHSCMNNFALLFGHWKSIIFANWNGRLRGKYTDYILIWIFLLQFISFFVLFLFFIKGIFLIFFLLKKIFFLFFRQTFLNIYFKINIRFWVLQHIWKILCLFTYLVDSLNSGAACEIFLEQSWRINWLFLRLR